MDKIINQFNKISQNRPRNFGNFYSENIVQIANWINNLDGLKTSYKLFDLSKQADWIRFSLIFSDNLILYPLGTEAKSIVIPRHNNFSKNIESITLPSNLFGEILDSGVLERLVLGYISCDASQLKDFYLKLKPLIKSSKVILCPDRIAFSIEDDPEQIGKKIYRGIPVSNESVFNKWIITPSDERDTAIPLVENLTDKNLQKELFTLSIPYLKGISFDDFSKILDDNNDCLSILRSHLKNMVVENRDVKTIKEMQEDLIRPEIDRLNMRFKIIQNIHRLRTSGVVLGSAFISLASYNGLGANVSIFSLFSSAGLGLFKSEERYQKEILELKETPSYLLWKIKNIL